jgi:hypothetical protein
VVVIITAAVAVVGVGVLLLLLLFAVHLERDMQSLKGDRRKFTALYWGLV